MTDRDPEPSRTLLSMQALRWRALAAGSSPAVQAFWISQ
jgi:hypothetical protein